jgi:hypothetical protein
MTRRIEYSDSGRVSPSTVEISGEIVGETALAWRFYDGTTYCWLPKSQCEWNEPVMEMPEWLASKRGLL